MQGWEFGNAVRGQIGEIRRIRVWWMPVYEQSLLVPGSGASASQPTSMLAGPGCGCCAWCRPSSSCVPFARRAPGRCAACACARSCSFTAAATRLRCASTAAAGSRLPGRWMKRTWRPLMYTYGISRLVPCSGGQQAARLVGPGPASPTCFARQSAGGRFTPLNSAQDKTTP